jgi:hypothetical protein
MLTTFQQWHWHLDIIFFNYWISVLAVDDRHVAFCEYNGSVASMICVAVATCVLFKFWSSFLLSLKLSSRYVFSYHPFYFDFHSARIIFDVSSGFYLWNVNMTPTWHLSKLFKVAFKDISTKNSEPTYWTIFFVMVQDVGILRFYFS